MKLFAMVLNSSKRVFFAIKDIFEIFSIHFKRNVMPVYIYTCFANFILLLIASFYFMETHPVQNHDRVFVFLKSSLGSGWLFATVGASLPATGPLYTPNSSQRPERTPCIPTLPHQSEREKPFLLFFFFFFSGNRFRRLRFFFHFLLLFFGRRCMGQNNSDGVMEWRGCSCRFFYSRLFSFSKMILIYPFSTINRLYFCESLGRISVKTMFLSFAQVSRRRWRQWWWRRWWYRKEKTSFNQTRREGEGCKNRLCMDALLGLTMFITASRRRILLFLCKKAFMIFLSSPSNILC